MWILLTMRSELSICSGFFPGIAGTNPVKPMDFGLVCLLCGEGHCDELITRSEESYRLCFYHDVCVCDVWISTNSHPPFSLSSALQKESTFSLLTVTRIAVDVFLQLTVWVCQSCGAYHRAHFGMSYACRGEMFLQRNTWQVRYFVCLVVNERKLRLNITERVFDVRGSSGLTRSL
jgi:hypothetical protein